MWIWSGIDVVTRLFIAFHIGDRSSNSAKTLIKTIKARTHGVPRLITSDGLKAYVEQIKAYFKGSTYAQEVKEWDGVCISRVYNFVRQHMSLTLGKGKGKQKRTPEIAAGLTDHVWNWEEVRLYHSNYLH